MDFSEELKNRVSLCEKIIYSYLPEEKGNQLSLIKAMNYAVKVGGKRLRPIFILEVLRLFKGNDSDAYPFMAAMECIHTYSLVHDDLPAMDDAKLRRGKPSVHVEFGEAMAVLAGDALLNYACEIVASAADEVEDPIKKARYIKALSVLFKKSGIFGMAGGQSVDVEEEGKPLDNETLDFIYRLKTGALIEASMMIGAILGGANKKEIEIIEEIASKVGMAFQIQDDILDLVSDESTLGKPVNIDEKNLKSTFASIHGIDKSREYVELLSQEAIELMHSLDYKNEFLSMLIHSLIRREK